MAQNSNNSDFGWKYQSRVKTLRWPIFLVRKPWDGPKFEEKSYSRQRWFEMWTKKWAISGYWSVIDISSRNLNCSNFGSSQSQMHIPSCDMTYFECFLDHLKDPPYDVHYIVQVQFYMISHIGISQTKKMNKRLLL